MSPAKASAKPKARRLTLEFSGICTLVWNQKTGGADVHLVDLSSAGFQRHYPALSLAVTSSSARGVKGPDADAAVSLLGEDKDIGLWSLRGCDVEILGASGKLTVDAANVDVTKKPPKHGGSIRWLADIGYLAESDRLDPACPTAAIVHLPAGVVSAVGGAEARKVQFQEQGQPVGPPRYCLPRFQAVIPFESELAIRLNRERVLRFTDSMSIGVSNTCVCGLGQGQPVNHFYGHYEVVRARRRPEVGPAGVGPKWPWWPEMCFGGAVIA